ncbi:MAG: transposase [Chthoniobacteraceae bacterium]
MSEELARATAELSEARTEIKLLREKIDALIQRLFGAQSEKLDAGQLLLMLQGIDAPGNEVSRSLFPVNLKRQKPRSPWKRRHHGARRPHRLRVKSAARACRIIFPSSRK